MNPVAPVISVKASGGNPWRFCLCLILLSFALLPKSVEAHQAHAGITEISWNNNTGEVEITHRLYAHDLEPRLFQTPLSGWGNTLEGIEKVGRYSHAKFMMIVDGEPVPLSYVGAEPEGEFIYIYFTAPEIENGKTIVVRDSLLMDAFDDQINLVNVTLNGQTHSQYFRYGDKGKTFLWQPLSD